MPSRRRLTIAERIASSGSHSDKSLPLSLASSTLDAASSPMLNSDESLKHTNRLVFISFITKCKIT